MQEIIGHSDEEDLGDTGISKKKQQHLVKRWNRLYEPETVKNAHQERSWRNQLDIFGVLKNYLRSWRNPLDIFGVLKNYLRSWQNRLDIFGVLKNYLSPPPAYLLMYHKKDMQPDYANDSPRNQSTQLDCDKNKPQKKANYKQEHQKNGTKRQTSDIPEQRHNLKKEKRDEQKPLNSREVERDNNPDEENQTCKNINPEMTREQPRTNESTSHTDLPRPSLLEQNQKEKTEQNKVKQKRSQSWPGGMTSRTSRRMTAAEQEQYEGMKQLIVTAIDGEKTTKKQNDTPGNDPNSSPTEHQRASVSDKPDKMDEELQVTNEQNS
ncbi:uncharacterized protein LOC122797953 [Protopterus annectens]|uniref:uncharacterized protein LOC122797953 n=1 Tax=Protopterus annectens TaxID=7888 RepID=UPI001CFBA2DE|nr:uncharacterized protein LOC122797953 [Protopterus annectens]